ncbi:MAG: replication initiator protein A [Arsenophonus sp. NC-PE1-MAG3]
MRDRRIYEIVSKHCGNQREFTIPFEKLQLKTGCTSLLKMFRFNIKELSKENDLADRSIHYPI